MRKMLAGKIVVLCALVVALLGTQNALVAQDHLPLIPVLFSQSNDSIAFYGLDEQNTLIEIGHLPAKFSLMPYQDVDRPNADTETLRLSNWWNMNVVLSPDGSQIALTADSRIPNRDAINFYLFLYDVQSGDIQQAYTTVWSGGPRTDLRWSPDSRAILIEPTYGESPAFQPPYAESFVYYLGSGQITQLPDTPPGKVWEADSNALLSVKGYETPNLILIDPSRNIQHEFSQVEGLSSESVDYVDPLCEFVWSPENQRWYFIAQCGTEITPAERVYSVALDGKVKLEADLHAYLTQALALPEDEFHFGSIDLHNLYAHDGNIYVALDFYYEVYSNNGQSEKRSSGWRVFKITNNQPIESVFEYDDDHLSDFTNAIPAPDFKHMAFVSDGMEGDEVVIGNLTTDSLIGSSVRTEWDRLGEYWRYWMWRWIDNQRFLYEDMDDVWLFDASDQTFTNLTGDMEQQAWLLPQTNSN